MSTSEQEKQGTAAPNLGNLARHLAVGDPPRNLARRVASVEHSVEHISAPFRQSNQVFLPTHVHSSSSSAAPVLRTRSTLTYVPRICLRPASLSAGLDGWSKGT